MLAFDIVLAFHPSPEEIGDCAASILKSDYDLKKVYLHSRAAGAEVNAQYGFTFGGDAAEQLRRYRADWVLLSVEGVSAQGGLTTYHAEEAALNRLMIEQGKRTVVVADHTKVGRPGFTRICDVGSGMHLVTDSKADGDALRALERTGMEVTVSRR